MIGEFDLIKKYFSGHDKGKNVELGIGDDCALMSFGRDESLAITTDTQNEGIHFFKGTDPYLLGYKSLLVNLSDLAAMGAQPRAFTLSLTLPDSNEEFLTKYARGLFELAKGEHVALIGGNTTKGPLSFTISAYGILRWGALERSNAKVGDGIYVTGTLGLPGLYVEAGYGRIPLDKSVLSSLCYKSMHIECRCAFARDLAERELSSCAIDISDGLVGDLMHILKLSGVGADLQLDKLPLPQELYDYVADPVERYKLAAWGGGDYELLFTVPSDLEEDAQEYFEECGDQVTRIGTITDSGQLRVMFNDKIFAPAMKSFEHF